MRTDIKNRQTANQQPSTTQTMKTKLIAATLLGLLGLLNFQFTADAQPVVTTSPASGIGATSARLNGTVNPNGTNNTQAQFGYGLTISYDHATALTNLGSGNVALPVSDIISSLAPGTTYHFQLAAGNASGATHGADRTFTTAPGAPTVTTLAASGV